MSSTPTHRILLKHVKEAIDDALIAFKKKLDGIKTPHTSTMSMSPLRSMCLSVEPYGIEPFVVDVVVDTTTNNINLRTDLDSLPPECYGASLPRSVVYGAINSARDVQDDKYGANKPQSLPGFLLLIQQRLDKASVAWAKDEDPLGEVTVLAALCVACLEKYGVTGSPITTDDIPQ